VNYPTVSLIYWLCFFLILLMAIYIFITRPRTPTHEDNNKILPHERAFFLYPLSQSYFSARMGRGRPRVRHRFSVPISVFPPPNVGAVRNYTAASKKRKG